MYLDRDNRTPLSPQLAVRVAIIGGVALVLFAIVFFRLWYLQVLSGDRYRAEANNNRVREITVQAPRGRIVDRNGRVLVDNRIAFAVTLSPDKLPKDRQGKKRLYSRLASVLNMKQRAIDRDVSDQLKQLPFSPATVKSDVAPAEYAYLLENQDRFPGVQVEKVALRKYPFGPIGAHLFGTVGEVNGDQLKNKRYRGVNQGARVGQSGVEYAYDRYLRGRDGANRVQVDALGNFRSQLRQVAPQAGRQLRLSVDYDVQRVGQQALGGAKAAFVVMDIKTGEVRALGSSPSFDPNIFAKRIRQSDYSRLSNEANGAPLLNRATQSVYPTGSTFKLITATAALQGGLITPDTPQYDPGFLRVGGITFHNAGGAVNGSLSLRKALQVSSDVFFYRLGQEANNAGDGHLIQTWARRLGLGRPTGIELPGESPGLVPTPEWLNRQHKKIPSIYSTWTVGQNINLAVGQGYLQVAPLQLAVAYAAIANGGYIVRPHLGERVEDADGRVIQEFNQPSRRKVDVKPEYRQAILDGLRAAAGSPGGTSYPVFKDFPIPIAGKTGTAQKGAGRADQSWYAALAPYPNPRYVVVSTFESGGFGADTAAPAVRKILAQLFGVKNTGPKSASSGGGRVYE
ncbi:MAG: penicillin-binding protein 2 [Thermoleophilaceae bacterium]|nr:penicillin-binding protein 2 [Thermoleophilaceae bacterium]